MAKVYNRELNVYSVDLMIAYVGLFKPEPVDVDIDNIRPSLELPYWLIRKDTKMVRLSPAQFLEEPDEYPYHQKIVDKVNTKYPIMIHTDYRMIDGAHRVVKAILDNQKTVKAYIFDDELMKKFLIDVRGNVQIGRYFSTAQQIQLFYKRFNGTPING
jgi:hypothetical protein